MVAYYNEIDPYAASWLRKLIAAGHLPPGDVDERSIEDVTPTDLTPYNQCHFFAGIGGWPLALRQAGWPDDRPVWTGSCPCQSFSTAGQRKGTADERHLWPAFLWHIQQCRPPVIFGEQVASSLALEWWDIVQADMEDAHYAATAFDLCAASVGAFQIRQRLFWVADAKTYGRQHGSAQPKRHRERVGEDQCQSIKPAIGGEEVCSMASAQGEQCQRCGSSWPRGNGFADRCAIGSMGNSHPSRHQACWERVLRSQDRPTERNTLKRASSTSAWANVQWIDCKDGKSRPIEPGSYPLAYGIPQQLGRLRARFPGVDWRAARTNRAGRLKGYGNAIVPPLAKIFIQSYLECEVEVSP